VGIGECGHIDMKVDEEGCARCHDRCECGHKFECECVSVTTVRVDTPSSEDG
jgi:hypothetical protein